MGLISRSRAAARAFRGVETKSYFEELLSLLSFGREAKAGVTVNTDTALHVAAVLACTRVLAEGISQLPLKLYQGLDNGGRMAAKQHPLYKLLWRRPNDWQTSFEFRETLMYHAVLTGNGYAYISRDGEGVPLELLPLVPTRVTPKQDQKANVTYEVRDAYGQVITLQREDMFHLRGPSWDSVHGMEVIQLAREAVGLAIATEESQAHLHKNGVSSSGVFSVDGKLDKPARDTIRERIKEMNAGLSNVGRVLILDQKGTYHPLAMTGVDAQHLETRKHQIEEICRALRVFPQMIGLSDKTSTYASAEQFFLAHVVHSLLPWGTRWEQAIARDLIDDDNSDLFAAFSFQGFLRGDAKTRAEYYASAIVNGWLTRNEVRLLEDYNPLPGLDVPLQPMNMQSGALAKSIVTELKSHLIGHNGGPPLDDAELERKVGRVLSAVNEKRITEADVLLQQVLATLEPAT